MNKQIAIWVVDKWYHLPKAFTWCKPLTGLHMEGVRYSKGHEKGCQCAHAVSDINRTLHISSCELTKLNTWISAGHARKSLLTSKYLHCYVDSWRQKAYDWERGPGVFMRRIGSVQSKSTQEQTALLVENPTSMTPRPATSGIRSRE